MRARTWQVQDAHFILPRMLLGDARVFVCTPGVNIPLTALCDGNADCANGDDETTTLCESELRGPAIQCLFFTTYMYQFA